MRFSRDWRRRVLKNELERNREKNNKMWPWRFGNTIPILMMRVPLRKTFLLFRCASTFITDLIALASSAIRFIRWHFRSSLQVISSSADDNRYSPVSLMILRPHRWFSISLLPAFDFIFNNFYEEGFCFFCFFFLPIYFSIYLLKFMWS